MTFLFALLSCWESNPEAVEDAQDRLVPAMERHDIQARAIETAIIDGDLARAKSTASALADRLPLPGLPARLDVHQQALRSAASSIAGASDLGRAASGVGELAVACGSCHSTVGLHAPPLGDMPNGEAWEDAMARHRWAADELWTSMVWMAPDRFEGAVRTWNQVPLIRPHTADEKRFTTEALALEERVHTLAAGAVTADTHARAALYGEMLTTCAACHALVRSP